MKLHVCAVYDSAAKAFNRPLFVPSTGLAIRGFIDEINRAAQENTLYQHPEDFTLHNIATWDEDTGEFTTNAEQPILVRGRDAAKRD